MPRPFPDDAAGSRAWYRLTGHAEGHYSLAIVNRGILGALATAHPGRVSLQVRDGAATGLSADAPDWLRELANVTVPAGAQAEVCSIVHHYPLIADPLPAGQRLALFFWEETTVSAEIAGQIEDGFDGVLVASRFVKRALRNSGGLGGYHWGLPVKRAMLAWEGARADAADGQEPAHSGLAMG